MEEQFLMSILTNRCKRLAAAIMMASALVNSATATAAANIQVTGNNLIIPTTTGGEEVNGTDFPRTPISGQTRTHTFSIRNIGDTNLIITPPVTIGGANPADFSVVMQPTAVIPPGQQSSF